MILELSKEQSNELVKALIIEISRLEYRLDQIRGLDIGRENAILGRISVLNSILDKVKSV